MSAYTLHINLSENALSNDDIVNNRSRVNASLVLTHDNSYHGAYSSYNNPWSINVGGQVFSGTTTYNFNNYSSLTLWSGTVYIGHNGDGTKYISASASFTDLGGGVIGNKSASAGLTLATIPRNSKITSSSSLTYYLGNDLSLGVTKYISGAIDSLVVKYGSTTLFSDNNYASGRSLSPIGSALTNIYNATSSNSSIQLTATLTTTYNGSVLGTSSLTFNALINADISLSVGDLIDVNPKTVALTGNNSKVVNGLSNYKLDFGCVLTKGGTLKHYVYNGTTYSNMPQTINGITNPTILVSVYSNRNNSETYSMDLASSNLWINYSQPTINISCNRPNPVDGSARITLNGTWFNGSFGAVTNTLTIKYRTKLKSSSTWGSWVNKTPTINGNSFSGEINLTGYTYTENYDCQVVALDKYYNNYEKIASATLLKGDFIVAKGEHAIYSNVPIYMKDNDDNYFKIIWPDD